jgi:MSHA biogenesis protein MshP
MSRLCKQRGLGLPAAIFIITVLALIAAAVNLLVEQNAQTYAEEINLTRAFYAAESGAGIAMNTIYPPEEYPAYGTTAECAAGPRTYELQIEGLLNCSVEVSCDLITHSGGSYATITSTGSCGDVQRTIRVRTVY